MARDTKKYAYYTIGILRDSATHRAILRDAEEHNTKQIPTVIGIRISEYYHLKQQGFSSATISPPEPSIEAAVIDSDHSSAIDNAKKSIAVWEDD